MDAPETLITPAPTDAIADEATARDAMLSGVDPGGGPAAESDIIQTVEASLAAVDQELAHLEEALRDDLAPFAQPIDATPRTAPVDTATEAAARSELESASPAQSFAADDPLAAQEAKLTEDLDALIVQTAGTPAAAVDTPPDVGAASADTIETNPSLIVASPEAIHGVADGPAFDTGAADAGAQPPPSGIAEDIEAIVDAEAALLAESATVEHDEMVPLAADGERSSEAVPAEGSTATEAARDDAIAASERERGSEPASEAQPTIPSADDAPPADAHAESGSAGRLIHTAAETAAIVAEELAEASSRTPGPSETTAPLPSTSTLRTLAIAPLTLAIRLSILLLIAIDLPFRWMSASLKNMIGLAGIATAMMAIATFLAAPYLKPAQAQDAARQTTSETQPATHTGSPSAPPSSGHPAAH